MVPKIKFGPSSLIYLVTDNSHILLNSHELSRNFCTNYLGSAVLSYISFLGGKMSPFCGATGILCFGFGMNHSWVRKPRWMHNRLCSFLACVWWCSELTLASLWHETATSHIPSKSTTTAPCRLAKLLWYLNKIASSAGGFSKRNL